jgi:hypothetical protein
VAVFRLLPNFFQPISVPVNRDDAAVTRVREDCRTYETGDSTAVFIATLKDVSPSKKVMDNASSVNTPTVAYDKLDIITRKTSLVHTLQRVS